MQNKSHREEITFFTGDEPDYYPTEWIEEYYCKDCKIKYKKGNWEIPNKYPPATYKQIKCVNFINRQLGTDFEPVLKTSTWKFINDHIAEAKEVQDNSFSEWCEDNAHWLPEYF
jgi:hypothetical protein